MKAYNFGNLIVERYVVGPLDENTYLVYEKNAKEVIIVDPGYKSVELVDRLKELAFNSLTIFITHGHGDHIGGVEFLQDHFPNIRLAVSLADSAMIKDPQLNLSGFIAEEVVLGEPQIIIKEGDTFKTGAHVGVAALTPGHTPGGTVLIFDEVVFSGDTLFREAVGRTDLPGGDPRAIIASIKAKLMNLSDRAVFPGHGSDTSIEHEKQRNPYISEDVFFEY